jgi:hypothetical protein
VALLAHHRPPPADRVKGWVVERLLLATTASLANTSGRCRHIIANVGKTVINRGSGRPGNRRHQSYTATSQRFGLQGDKPPAASPSRSISICCSRPLTTSGGCSPFRSSRRSLPGPMSPRRLASQLTRRSRCFSKASPRINRSARRDSSQWAGRQRAGRVCRRQHPRPALSGAAGRRHVVVWRIPSAQEQRSTPFYSVRREGAFHQWR